MATGQAPFLLRSVSNSPAIPDRTWQPFPVLNKRKTGPTTGLRGGQAQGWSSLRAQGTDFAWAPVQGCLACLLASGACTKV